MSYFLYLILGVFVGIVSGLCGVGGGILYVPALVIFAGIPIKKAVGISLAIIALSAFAGAYKHYTLGNVEFLTAALVIPGAIFGTVVGAWLTGYVSPELLKKILGCLLLLIGLNFIFEIDKSFFNRVDVDTSQ